MPSATLGKFNQEAYVQIAADIFTTLTSFVTRSKN